MYYVTMSITFLTRKFRNKEHNLHCEVAHIAPKWASSLTLDCNGVFAIKAYVALSRPQSFQRLRFLAPCLRLRAIVCVLSAFLRGDKSSACLCLRIREQCLRSEITSVTRVRHVLPNNGILRRVTKKSYRNKRPRLAGV